MARVIPDGWRELAVTGAARREIETLAMLAEGLPEAFTVYHGVHWTQVEGRYAAFGEIDFAIVNRSGDLVLIEQKSGFLDETPEGLVKRYPGRTKSVPVQMARNRDALVARLRQRPGTAEIHADGLLYCPDYRVRDPGSAGVAPERIVDSESRGRLAWVIRDVLPEGQATPAAETVHRFLRDVIRLEPDVSALLGRARDMVTRVSGGLAHWARQLEMEPYRLRVSGTAGSGKTQLALAEFRAALASGRRPLYVCFNRPLADHFAAIAPEGGLACTFHSLCDLLVRAAGRAPDFSAEDAFERLVRQAAELAPGEDLLFDAVIVDEGQDFSETWRDLALRHARPGARLLWLEDPLQNLYARPPVALPGWVCLHARSNFRSPRPVVRMLRALVPGCEVVEAASPFDAADVEVLTYADEEGMKSAVKEAIRQCYSAGFRREDVAIVSYHGRGQSRLMNLARLGSNTLRRFTGRYDLLGQPVYDDGDLLVESVYRFKGQSAPAVIFAEIDCGELDDRALRKLFVGATRAMMKLVLVASEPAARALSERL